MVPSLRPALGLGRPLQAVAGCILPQMAAQGCAAWPDLLSPFHAGVHAGNRSIVCSYWLGEIMFACHCVSLLWHLLVTHEVICHG